MLKQRFFTAFGRTAATVVVLVCAVLATAIADDIDQPIRDALDRGDTATAINLIQKDIDGDPGYYFNYYVLGTVYFEREDWQNARIQFEKALEQKSKHWESLYHLGLTYIELGMLDKAEEAMSTGRKKSKEIKDKFEDGYGLVKLAQKEYQEADKAFRQALVIEPDNPDYHIHLGDANYYQGIPSLAILEYEKALQADTASTEVFFHWAEACLEMRDYSCAIEKLQIVLTKDSTHAKAWNRAASIYFRAALSSHTRDDRVGRFKDAIGSYKKYFDLADAPADSAHVRSYYELALAYVNIGGYDNAVETFEQILAIPYEPKDIHFYYGKALWGVQRYADGAEALEKHIAWVAQQDEEYSTPIRNWELYQLLGDCYYYQKPNKFLKAIDNYKKSLEERPDQKRLIQNIAVGYHRMKSYGQAIEYYQKRIDLGLEAKDANIYRNAGYCALNLAGNAADDGMDDLDDLDESESLVDLNPEMTAVDPDVDYYQVAVDYLKSYLELQPDDEKVVLLVANTYLYQMADCANGVKYFEELDRLNPKDCIAKKSLGFAYFGGICTKNYGKALGYLRSAYDCIVASRGECGDVELVKWIAQSYHLRAAEGGDSATSDFKNAFEWYEKVLKCNPNDSEAKQGRDQVRFEF